MKIPNNLTAILRKIAADRAPPHKLTPGYIWQESPALVSAIAVYSEIELLYCVSAGWHKDLNPNINTIIVLENPNHLVQAGKRQNLPAEQPSGTIFRLDTGRLHRCHALSRPYAQVWVGLSLLPVGTIEDDIEFLMGEFL